MGRQVTVLHSCKGRRTKPLHTSQISSRLRGEVLYRARGSCSNCGRNIEIDGIVLVVDLKIPREQGGMAEPDNLWAICEECNAGTKSCFKSVDAVWMRDVMALNSVHMRLGETLKVFMGAPVPAQMMAFVSNQDDWRKRLRELRYLGWEIDVLNPNQPNGRVSSFYKLVKAMQWPEDPTAVIRRYEQERAKRNKNR